MAGAFTTLTAQDLRQKIQSLYQRGQEAQRRNRFDEAIECYRKIIALDPQLPEAYANLGVVQCLKTDYAAAIAAFQRALELKPSLGNAEMLLGISEARMGRLEHAIPLLEKAFRDVRRDDLWRQTGLQLVEAYYAGQDQERALDVVRALRRQFPDNAQILYLAYRIHSDLGSKAVAALVKAEPESALLHQITAEMLESEGDYPRAVDQYRRALEKAPDLPGLRRALASALLQASSDPMEWREAVQQLEKELSRNPGDSTVEYLLGEVAWRQAETDQALGHFRRALHLRPSFPEALVAMGRVLTARGEIDQATEYLRKAVAIDPVNEVAHFRLAQAYQKAGRQDMATQEMGLFQQLREASASLRTIHQQVKRNILPEEAIDPGAQP